MRKFILSVFLIALSTCIFSQTIKDVQEKISKGKYEEAKQQIDVLLSDPQNQSTANAWYYKGKIYSELARLDSTGSLTYDAGKMAFDAFKKYQELDKQNVMMALDQNVGLFQLYDLFYNQGIRMYNNKDFGNAYAKMRVALDIQDYISKKSFSYNGFTFPALDTQLVNLTASSAYLAKNDEDAMPLWARLAEARISDKDFKDIYALLAEYYTKKNDIARAEKYLRYGKEIYGDTDFWISVEYDLTKPGKDTAKRFARYEEMIKKYPDHYPLVMDYAIEQFNYTYSNDKKPLDYSARQQKLNETLKKALSLKSTAIANFVMSQHLYYQIFDLEDVLKQVKGTNAPDQTKRKELLAEADHRYDAFYPYALKAYDLYSFEKTPKMQDKMNLRKVMEQLVDYHEKKKQPEKVAFYKEKLKTL